MIKAYSRGDGIGSRILQMLLIQQYCYEIDTDCEFIWRNTKYRNYDKFIDFDRILYCEESNAKSCPSESTLRKKYRKHYSPRFNFNFETPKFLKFDAIIHIRAGDRILNESVDVDRGSHFSNKKELEEIIEEAIDFVKNSNSINSYAIVTESPEYIFNDIIKNKEHVKIPKTENNEFSDFYYLCNPTKYVVMASKFSTYPMAASILGGKTLVVSGRSEFAVKEYIGNKARIKIM